MPDLLSQKDDPSCCWLSAHIYFRGDVYGASCDHVVMQVVAPFVRMCLHQGWSHQYFFVRYGDVAGPHVRLRLFGDETTLEDRVKPALRHHVASHLPAALAAHLSPDAYEPETQIPVRWIAYEPEIDRYGGPEAVALAEWFFHYSSEAALALLESTVGQPQSARLGKGLLAMLVLLHTFLDDPEAVAALCYQYARGYLRARITDEETRANWMTAFDAGYNRQASHLEAVVEAVWKALDADASLNETLDAYRQGLRSVQSQLLVLQQHGQLHYETDAEIKPIPTPQQAWRVLVPNYLHMTNNRLGITIPEEAYLAHLIRHTLSQHLLSQHTVPSLP